MSEAKRRRDAAYKRGFADGHAAAIAEQAAKESGATVLLAGEVIDIQSAGPGASFFLIGDTSPTSVSGGQDNG